MDHPTPRLAVVVFINFSLWFEMSGPGGVPGRLRPSLDRVGAPGAVGPAGGGGGGGLALVLRTSCVRTPRPGAHSTETEKLFLRFFPLSQLQIFSCLPHLEQWSFTLFMVI